MGLSMLPSPGPALLPVALSCPEDQLLTQGTSLSSMTSKDHHLGLFCKALGDAENRNCYLTGRKGGYSLQLAGLPCHHL